MRIILVEDHDDLRDVTVENLVRLGHTAHGARNGLELQDIFADIRPHILILDLNLPGEDGVSLSRRYRQAHPGIGIIMMTARTQVHHKVEGYDSGADIYLTKPTAFDELSAAIEALSRRISIWAKDSGQMDVNPQGLNAAARARKIHQQLTQMVGKLPTQSELAEQYACPYRTINKEFEDEYGQSIRSYMTDYRLNLAHKAVLETDLPIKVIAGRCGYAHLTNFTDAFQAKFGCLPSALRKGNIDEG